MQESLSKRTPGRKRVSWGDKNILRAGFLILRHILIQIVWTQGPDKWHLLQPLLIVSANTAEEGKKSRLKEPCGENNEFGSYWWYKIQHRVRQEQRNPSVILNFFHLLLGF